MGDGHQSFAHMAQQIETSLHASSGTVQFIGVKRLNPESFFSKVGGLSKLDKLLGSKGIKSMADVLEAMREQCHTQLNADQRKKVKPLCLKILVINSIQF